MFLIINFYKYTVVASLCHLNYLGVEGTVSKLPTLRELFNFYPFLYLNRDSPLAAARLAHGFRRWRRLLALLEKLRLYGPCSSLRLAAKWAKR